MNTFMSAQEALEISKANGWTNNHEKMIQEIEEKIKNSAHVGNVCTDFTVELNTSDMQICSEYVSEITTELEKFGYTTKIHTALVGKKTQIPITVSWFNEKE